MRKLKAVLAVLVVSSAACAVDSAAPPPPPPALALGGETTEPETTALAGPLEERQLEPRGSDGNFLPDSTGDVRLTTAAEEVAVTFEEVGDALDGGTATDTDSDSDIGGGGGGGGGGAATETDTRLQNQYRGLVSVALRTQESTITPEESECAAAAIVGELGVDALAALDIPNNPVPAFGDQSAVVITALETCVGFGTISQRAVQEYFAADTNVDCLASAMTGGIRNGFQQALTTGADTTESAFFDIAFGLALDDCDAGITLLFDGLRAEGAPDAFLACVEPRLDPELVDAAMAPTATADEVDAAIGPAIFSCA